MARAWLMHATVIAGLTVAALGFQYPSLPADNLLENPWFRADCNASLDGWTVDQTADGLSWGPSDKVQNPSDEDCDGEYAGNAARWARQSGNAPELSPDQDARIWQVVGPVDPDATVLRFHVLIVAHRMTQLRAQISGSASPDGPWTEVWTPLDAQWLAPGGANGPFDGTCPGGPQDRECLWDLVTEAELGSLEPLVHEIEEGHPYYRIEFLGNYPQPDATATGDVGAKVTRVYFAVEGEGAPTDDTSGDTSSDDTSGDGSAGETGASEGGTGGSGDGSAGLDDTHGATGTAGDESMGGTGDTAGGSGGEGGGCGCVAGRPHRQGAFVVPLVWLGLRVRRRAHRLAP
jgi:hypothetical protein